MRLSAVVINYNTVEHTRRCVRSLLRAPQIEAVVILDNASCADDRSGLQQLAAAEPRCLLILGERNLGFAAGCNLAIAAALDDASIDGVLLLNSDAVLTDSGLDAMLAQQAMQPRASMIGGRILKPDGSLDSLGIALYWSCLASNRMDERDVLFGPTGGCAIYGRDLIDDMIASHGYVFDPEFFCYCEDTDLAARALLRGYRPSFATETVAEHVGQASSGGGFNDFVLYHGIRNSIWTLAKTFPWPILLAAAPLIALLHAGIVVRHLLKRRGRVLWRLYRDALRGLPHMLRKRGAIQRSRRIGAIEFARRMTPKFYDSNYMRRSVRELL